MSIEFTTDLIPADGKGYPEGRKAAGYRLVIQLDSLEQDTASGITAYSNEEYMRYVRGIHTGMIVDVGEFAYCNTDSLGGVWAKKGDRVRFKVYGGDVYKEGGKYYRIINDEDIFEILEMPK